MNTYVGEYKSHAKAILLGEHSIVHGGYAIASAIPELTLKARAILAEQENESPVRNTFRFDGEQIDEAYLKERYPGISCILEILPIPEGYSLNLEIDSQIPQSRGLGSSAASALAVSKALCEAIEKHSLETTGSLIFFDDREIHNLVSKAEDAVHTKASGLDQAAVTSNGTIFFSKGSDGMNAWEELPTIGACLVVADTGIEKDTGRSVGEINRRLKSGDKYVSETLETLGNLALKNRESWDLNHLKQIGSDMDLAQELLSSLNLSTPELDKLIRIMKNAGALGAKLSGGGCGGIAIGLFKTEKEAIKAVASIEASGRTAWKVRI